MKKEYVKPAMQVVKIEENKILCASEQAVA